MPSLMTNTADDVEAGLDTALPGSESVLMDSGCFHCGTPLPSAAFTTGGKSFCCQGCQTVFELITENGLGDFYRLGKAAGVRAQGIPKANEFTYLDDPALRQRLVDFSDNRVTRVTFRVPSMHCIACVWLLENLFRFNPGIGYCRVNFPRKEVFVTFENSKVKLSEVVALLASLGYAPRIQLFGHRRPPAKSGLAAAVAATGRGGVRLRQHHVDEHFLLSWAGRLQRTGIEEIVRLDEPGPGVAGFGL